LVLEDIDVKHLRWVSFIVSDGSQIRSLSGRSAKLGDGYSRNPKDRDELVEQRTKDLSGRMGQLRGFSLEAFLADHAEEEKAFPWSIGDDAVPDVQPDRTDAVQMVAELAASSGVIPVLKVAFVMDYYDVATGRRRAEELEQVLKTLVAGRWVKAYPVPGAFEDDLGSPAQFAVPGGLSRQKRLLAIRKDSNCEFGPEGCVLGPGPGLRRRPRRPGCLGFCQAARLGSGASGEERPAR
jgi:hypothetical protein